MPTPVGSPPMALSREDRELVLALFLMDEHGHESYEPEEAIESTVAWFKSVEHEMQKPHCGDCTKVPMSCIRCNLERYAEIAMRLRAALQKADSS